MHSLEIVQWDSTRRDHPGYPGRVSGSCPVRFLVRFMLFLMEIILPSGLKPCVAISKAASCGFMSLVTVIFQNKWTKKLILPMPFGLRIEKLLIIRSSLGFVIHLSILDEFGNIDVAKEVWDFLVTRYVGSSGTRNFKLTHELYHILQ